VEAADCAILRATPSFICSGDTSGNVCISKITTGVFFVCFFLY